MKTIQMKTIKLKAYGIEIQAHVDVSDIENVRVYEIILRPLESVEWQLNNSVAINDIPFVDTNELRNLIINHVKHSYEIDDFHS